MCGPRPDRFSSASASSPLLVLALDAFKIDLPDWLGTTLLLIGALSAVVLLAQARRNPR